MVLRGLNLFRIDVRRMCVLLKPNLVEDLPEPVNTNPILIGAAARADQIAMLAESVGTRIRLLRCFLNSDIS
jgi:hypothetical protein